MKCFSTYKKYKIDGVNKFAPIGLGEGSEEYMSLELLNGSRISEIQKRFIPDHKLKPYQKEVMEYILSGNNTFTILPTGSGKSICFQAPSVFFPGITLVVTPLTALIEDQVENFNKKHIVFCCPENQNKNEIRKTKNICFKAIYPGINDKDERQLFSEIQNFQIDNEYKYEIKYKLLYLTPERLCSPKFLKELKKAEKNGLRINHIVIDEVHCMSQWGFDFRESYLHIINFIKQRPVRPIISAFTATATQKDIEEIKNIFSLAGVNNFKYKNHITERKNLSLQVIQCLGDKETQTGSLKTRYETLIDMLEKNKTKVCIIYPTTEGVDELYSKLEENRLLRGRLVKYYGKGKMLADEKRENQKLFLSSYDGNSDTKFCCTSKQCKNIMIATNAFGLGIDKEDISLVIHYDVPRSLENYYQEVGRAGRNTEKVPQADCCLLYADGPINEKGTLQNMIHWIVKKEKAEREYKKIPLDFTLVPVEIKPIKKEKTNEVSASTGDIFSQFSEEMKESIYFWSYYRLCYIKKYCDEVKINPQNAQKFIIEYLNQKFDENIRNRIAAELDSFYNYIINKCRKDFKEVLFAGSDAYIFLDFAKRQKKPDILQKEIKQLLNSVNEIYINNTHAANFLRDHPGKYELDKPFEPGDCPDSGQITIHGREKLSYFDMCVMDAIYTIEATQKGQINIEKLWKILTGSTPLSSQKRKFQAEIRNSIEKMCNMFISIVDKQISFEKRREVFLPLKKPKGQRDYSYSVLPPLYEFAEKKNHQIITIPISLLNTANIKQTDLASTIDNTSLCHYLMRRIAISRYTGYKKINFATIKKAIHINEDSYLFKKKAVAIMNYYQKIGYCDEYYLYTLQDTNVKNFFQAGTLTRNSERNPVTVSLSRLDGIYLRSKK